VRLAQPDEAALYRQAAAASQSADDLMLVYLVELVEPEDQLQDLPRNILARAAVNK
jgi:hypothetical protein